MKFTNANAELFIPDGLPVEDALSRTTHMGIGAHQDDLEFMTYHGILECFGQPDKWYAGVVATDGAGSPRAGLYAGYTDEEMRKIRKVEQRKAATLGEYTAQVMLDYPSSAVKDPANTDVVRDLKHVLEVCRPSVVYTHNLADKHDTHVGTALKAIQAIRELPEEIRPSTVYGCEAWRSLDWLNDDDKVLLDVAEHENLAAAVMGVFDSQIAGGKRYDLATIGRRRANATYLASHGTDTTTALIYAIDMTPLIKDPELDVREFIISYVNRLAEDIASRLARLS
jgi:LmbE family N-acetylglucosaminyl deacetylase